MQYFIRIVLRIAGVLCWCWPTTDWRNTMCWRWQEFSSCVGTTPKPSWVGTLALSLHTVKGRDPTLVNTRVWACSRFGMHLRNIVCVHKSVISRISEGLPGPRARIRTTTPTGTMQASTRVDDLGHWEGGCLSRLSFSYFIVRHDSQLRHRLSSSFCRFNSLQNEFHTTTDATIEGLSQFSLPR